MSEHLIRYVCCTIEAMQMKFGVPQGYESIKNINIFSVHAELETFNGTELLSMAQSVRQLCVMTATDTFVNLIKNSNSVKHYLTGHEKMHIVICHTEWLFY